MNRNNKTINTLRASITAIYGLLCMSALSAASPTVKITNASEAPVAFVLVQTERGSRYQKLYQAPGLSSDAASSLAANSTKVFFLHSGEDTVIPNYPQNIRSYDRVLWVVPLEVNQKIETYLQKLGLSVKTGSLQVPIKAFEVGSAKAVVISGKAHSLKADTTGKFSEGAKQFFKLNQTKPQAVNANEALVSHSVEDLVHGTATRVIQGRMVTRSASGITPKKSIKKTTKAAQGNPAGWPANAKLSFKEAVQRLELSTAHIENLKKYPYLDYEEKSELRETIMNTMRIKQTNAKKEAYELIKSYTNNFQA